MWHPAPKSVQGATFIPSIKPQTALYEKNAPIWGAQVTERGGGCRARGAGRVPGERGGEGAGREVRGGGGARGAGRVPGERCGEGAGREVRGGCRARTGAGRGRVREGSGRGARFRVRRSRQRMMACLGRKVASGRDADATRRRSASSWPSSTSAPTCTIKMSR